MSKLTLKLGPKLYRVLILLFISVLSSFTTWSLVKSDTPKPVMDEIPKGKITEDHGRPTDL